MKIAVIGSRSFNNYDLLKQKLDTLPQFTLISGGAKGADTLAERYADEKGYTKIIIKPDWSVYGRAAGVYRNQQMINLADEVVAFWSGTSKGTEHSIKMARKKGIPVTVIMF